MNRRERKLEKAIAKFNENDKQLTISNHILSKRKKIIDNLIDEVINVPNYQYALKDIVHIVISDNKEIVLNEEFSKEESSISTLRQMVKDKIHKLMNKGKDAKITFSKEIEGEDRKLEAMLTVDGKKRIFDKGNIKLCYEEITDNSTTEKITAKNFIRDENNPKHSHKLAQRIILQQFTKEPTYFRELVQTQQPVSKESQKSLHQKRRKSIKRSPIMSDYELRQKNNAVAEEKEKKKNRKIGETLRRIN